MAADNLLTMVFGEPITTEKRIEHKVETMIEKGNKQSGEKITTNKVVKNYQNKTLFETLSEHNDFEQRAMLNITTNNSLHKHDDNYKNQSHHEQRFSNITKEDHNYQKKHYHDVGDKQHSMSQFNHGSHIYSKARTESLLSSSSSSLFESVINDFNDRHHHSEQFSEATLTDGERTPLADDFKSVKSELTMIPQRYVERNLKSPCSSRASTVVDRHSIGQTHEIRNIVTNERIKELTEQLREEIHLRNKYKSSYSEMSIEEELAHLPDEPEDDSLSVASEYFEHFESGRHSAHYLTHSKAHSIDPISVNIQTPISTRAPSVVSVISQKPKKYEIKEYSLKKPIEPTPNPNPITPYTVKPRYTTTVHDKIKKKKNQAPKSPNPTPRQSIDIHNEAVQRNKLINSALGKKSAYVKRMNSIRVNNPKDKNGVNYDFNIKNDKTLICCNCGCHHVFTSGIPNLRFSVIKRVIGTESRRGSVISPNSEREKMSINDKNKYFNISTK
uniref:SH2 domain-containing protein n=1 Tax=Parastrongyloides trichosuri TaxID=131310 RepID=A0A0N4ZBL9_PARTI